MPHLQKTGSTAQMIVDGKPFLMLAGELHNSSASSVEYMRPIWDKLVDLKLNTVIGTASWELIEPVEGKFDFSSVDAQIAGARQHSLRLVLIWFGTWKSTSGSYAPMWVKTNPQRFPMARTQSGKQMAVMGLPFEGISVFGKEIIPADAKAFRALMRHIRETDTAHTVILVQVENEPGLFGDSRDRSALAEAAWSRPVPAELLNYMTEHKATLRPELISVWGRQGFKTGGSWEEVFGADAAAGEVFMAWHLARAIDAVAAAGKAELPLPMYTNAWLGPVANMKAPGEYPSGGPVAGMLDIWRAAAPRLDFLGPNTYVADFRGVCDQYARSDNPLFIPETYVSPQNLFLAVGQYSALGYSPFGIDGVRDGDALRSAYDLLGALAPTILKYQPEGKVMTVIQEDDAAVKKFEAATGLSLKFGDLGSVLSFPGAGGKKSDAATEQKKEPPPQGPDFGFPQAGKDTRGYALVIFTAPNEFLIAGSGVIVTNRTARLGTVDELLLEKGHAVPGRRLNGDEIMSGNLFPLGMNAPEVRKVVTYRNQ
jgi:hypothetical protein